MLLLFTIINYFYVLITIVTLLNISVDCLGSMVISARTKIDSLQFKIQPDLVVHQKFLKVFFLFIVMMITHIIIIVLAVVVVVVVAFVLLLLVITSYNHSSYILLLLKNK